MARARVTISDVAREAGVALGTVSNVLNHPDKVRPETLALVNEAIAKLGYAPNQSARMLAGGSNRSFGLVLNNMEHGISLQIANGANAEARKNGYGLLIANTDNSPELRSQYLRYFAGTQMAGVLVQATSAYDWEFTPSPGGIPLAYLDCHNTAPGYYVSADNIAQGRLIAEHAVECGARHVVIFGKDLLYKLGKRLKGIRSVAECNPDVTFEFVDEGSWNLAHDGYAVGYRLGRRGPSERPDFVIALSDVLATGAIAGLQAAGLSVPDDVRIAGCDGNPLAWSGNIPLTTIAPPGYEIGRRGVQFLIQQIEERRAAATSFGSASTVESEENHQELIRPFLLARASTGASSATEFADPDIDISGYL